MNYTDVIQLKLKTPDDLRHHLRNHGPSRHIIHDSESDWWWFCDHRDRLLEHVFNFRAPVTFQKVDCNAWETVWLPECRLVPDKRRFELRPTFINTAITEGILADLFWNEFLSQDLGQYAYWDMDNDHNVLEEYLFYWEMQASGLHMESALTAGDGLVISDIRFRM